MRILFCADPLRPGLADEHFAGEAEVARELGRQVSLIDHDALLAGDAEAAVRRVPQESGDWWYRGWMIPTPSYVELDEALRQRGARMRVPPRLYRAAHELPNWYLTFAEHTPESGWLEWSPHEVPGEEDVRWLTELLDESDGPAIVKDYVKSRKHEWHEACFIPDTGDIAHATAVVARMVELQGDGLAGGIVLRRFEDYRDGGEARVWWVDGEAVLITAHPDTPGRSPEPDLNAIAPLVAAFGCPFVTTDLARHTDGRWRVVEVGDGQVSDLPPGADVARLLERLAGQITIDAPTPCPRCGAAAVPILYGLPTPEARQAGAEGRLALYGCIRPDNPPQWRCAAGHEWAAGEARWQAAIAAAID